MDRKVRLSCSPPEDDDKYVDIHGRELTAVIYGKSGEVAFPLSELKQTGVGIYQKSQYAKLATVDKQFDDDFHVYMLESAREYMLVNKISFSGEEILKGINNCKRILTEKKKESSPQGIFGNRKVEKSDDEIHIQVSNTPRVVATPQTPSAKRKSLKSPKQPAIVDPEKIEIKADHKPHLKKKVVNEEKSQSNTDNFNKTKQNDNSPPKLRPPKTKILEKVDLNERKQIEHEVVVTCIDKRNCIWVRDKANQEIFNTIFKKIINEVKFQQPALKPFHFEKVYLAQDNGIWLRCKIVRFMPLTVFFLDYGNIAEVDDLKNVSDDLAKIPCMAIRLTFRENEYVPVLQDELKIKILKQNEDGTYFVNVLEVLSDNLLKIHKPTMNSVEYETSKVINKRPPPLCQLENGMKVMIIHEEDAVLYLRSREGCQKLKEIETELEDEVKSAAPLDRVEVNQLVLVEDDKMQFHRAVVINILKNRIDVEYLDHVKRSIVNISSLRKINESLSQKPVTYLQGGKVKGFEELNNDCKKLIDKSIKLRKKYSVILDDNGDFDLFDGTQSLSAQFQDMDTSGVIFLKDMKRFEPEMGVKTYLCGCFKESTDFALVPSDELANHIDSVLMQEMEDTVPYQPVAGEVCYCYYMDQWYRCIVTRILNKEFEVLLLDFGNVEFVAKNDLRKAVSNITDIPALALPCRLINLPEHPQVEDLLKKMVIEGELYKVDVKRISEGKCDVEIPTVYQQIRKTVVK